jgi:hypothetical protein
MATLKNAAAQLGIILALVGSAMFALDVGLSEMWNIIASNDVSHETRQIFQGSPDMVDRVTVALMGATLASAAGLITISRSNPEAVNTVLRYAPWLGLAVGLTQFSTEVIDIITGEFDFSTASDATAGMLLAVTGWVMSGATSLLGNRK